MGLARGIVLFGLTVWLIAGSAILVVHLHRSVMGRNGYADWTRRAVDAQASPADQARAMAAADFELQVAKTAEPWIWPSLAFGIVTPALTGGLLLVRRRRRYATPSRILS